MAIPAHLRLEFVTPERAIVHEDVDEVQLPGEEGSFGVLPGHAPLLAALRTGELWYRKGTQTIHAFVDGGFVEVLPNRVSVLAQVAERAEEHLASATSEVDTQRARAALLKALFRLEVSRRIRPRA